MLISALLLDNVHVRAKIGMIVRDAKGVELRDVQITAQKGEPLTIRDAEVKSTKAVTGARR
jgi:hypothetical protein